MTKLCPRWNVAWKTCLPLVSPSASSCAVVFLDSEFFISLFVLKVLSLKRPFICKRKELEGKAQSMSIWNHTIMSRDNLENYKDPEA